MASSPISPTGSQKPAESTRKLSDYPAALESTHKLFDGSEVRILPARPEDAAMGRKFIRNLSDDSRYYRFMEHLNQLPKRKLQQLSDIDYDQRMVLLASIQGRDGEQEIGMASYVANPQDASCEFAIAVADAWQGTGIAGILMLVLMQAARARGLKTMEGFVLSSNSKMLKFARQLGFSLHHEPGDFQTVRVVRAL